MRDQLTRIVERDFAKQIFYDKNILGIGQNPQFLHQTKS